MLPRVSPRTPLQDRVDTEAHHPRGELSSVPETAGLQAHWTTKLAFVLLVVFWVTLPIALGLVWIWPAIGSAIMGLALGSLISSILLGAS